MMKRAFIGMFCVFLSFMVMQCSENNQTDLIIFSYNRPLQLYALLESIEKYVTGIDNTYILLRADDKRFLTAYEEVFSRFSFVTPFLQTFSMTHNDFYEIMITLLEKSSSKYCLFAVDDIIVKDYFDTKEAIQILEKTEAYAFFYRLGLHLSICYPHVRENDPESGKQKVPPVKQISDHIYLWEFNKGEGDWNYPNNVDMTLYRTKDILETFATLPKMDNPNKIEEFWSRKRPKNNKGVCYQHSKVVNIPINIVQDIHNNRHMNLYTTEELLTFFKEGLKIDISTLYNIKNESAHINYIPTFIKRSNI